MIGKDSTPEEVINRLCGPEICSSKRPYALIDWAKSLDFEQGSDFWRVVAEIWPSCDAIPHSSFEELFGYFLDYAPECNLPPRITIYRGQDADTPLGLAWTTNREVAEGFAFGHRGKNNPKPTIFSIEVRREAVAFVATDREEDEIVLLSIPTVQTYDIRQQRIVAHA